MRRLRATCAALVFTLTASFGLTAREQSLSVKAELAAAPMQVYSGERVFEDLIEAVPASTGAKTQADSWDIHAPTGLRPCCALGHNLAVSVGPVPVPVVRLDNVLEPHALGRHRYNSNLLRLEVSPEHGLGLREQNGLLYTCGAGVVDIAHVRDYADLTVYLYALLLPRLGTQQTVHLPEQAGRRVLHLHDIDDAVVARIGRERLAREVAGALAFDLSVWHETASWYGWSSIALFPETVSAFSPEDLYTNVLGIRLAFALIEAGRTRTQRGYEEAMDDALPRLLARVGAMPAALSRSVLSAMDGLWWTSSERLPRREMVQFRSFDTGPYLTPLRVGPDLLRDRLGREVAAWCLAWKDEPVVLEVPGRMRGLTAQDAATLEIEPEPRLIEAMPARARRHLTQHDLPAVVAQVADVDRRMLAARAGR